MSSLVNPPTRNHLSLDSGFAATSVLLNLEQTRCQIDVVLEVLLSIQVVLTGIRLVLLNVQTNRGSAAASTRQTDDDAAAIVKLDVDTLVLANAAVKVSVGEVASVNDLAALDGRANELVLLGGDQLRDVSDHLVGALGLAALVVITSEESAAVRLPKVLLDRLDAGGGACLLADTSKNVQPSNDGPETVLLANVVTASTERLLAADVHLVGVEQTAEELPASRHLVRLHALGLGNKVNRTRGGHGACETVDTLLLEVGDEVGVVGDDGQAVTGRDEGVGAVDHVAVTITVASSTKVDALGIDHVDEGLGVDEVGVWVVTTKVRLGDAVLSAVLDAKLLLEDVDCVRAGDTAEAIEQDLEVGVLLKERPDQIEVEDALQHGEVVFGRVDDFHLEGAGIAGTSLAQVNVGDFGNLVLGQGFGGSVDLVGDALGSRSTVSEVVLDTKILLRACMKTRLATASTEAVMRKASRTTRVVAGGEQDTAGSVADTNDIAGSGSAENAILADNELLDAVRSSDLSDQLNDLRVPVSAITTNDEGAALNAFGDGKEDGSHESLAVVGLLEDLDLLTKTGAMGQKDG